MLKENPNSAINYPVLMLSQNYEPLNVCRVRRAVVLIYGGKAEMLEDGSGFIHSADRLVPLPSVIRLAHIVKRPRLERKMTRHEIFNRDKYTCQYCGRQTQQLTLDHIIPRSRGGEHTWENVVSACVTCNHRKAGRTPEQAGMKLLHTPTHPHNNLPFHVPYHYIQSHDSWLKYFPQ